MSRVVVVARDIGPIALYKATGLMQPPAPDACFAVIGDIHCPTGGTALVQFHFHRLGKLPVLAA